MAKQTYYRQCVLTQPTERGQTRLVTWIPERHHGIDIEAGVTLRLKGQRPVEEPGTIQASDPYLPGRWTVESVGSQRRPESVVKDLAHHWHRSRQVTEA